MNNLVNLIENHEHQKYNYLVTPNVDHVLRIKGGTNSQFHRAYDGADYVVCDSRILKLVSKLYKHPIKHVIPGSDLTKLLFENSLSKKRVMVIGGQNDDVETLYNLFNVKHISLYSPPFGFIEIDNEVEKCINAIENENPDIVFLAVGSPRQEVLAMKLKETHFRGFALCVGASIDFLVGRQKRAPQIVQLLHLEWLYRMLSQPKRLLGRYLKSFIPLTKLIIDDFQNGKLRKYR
ncbi:WecB/TagA/CpsF family glycosyltransferase [Thalassotalea sp. PS06]|uniref:WecB/TagA/CpsF family glycosyltransferase n=1 Tax=Thalassotalea sp. PS06 TaxID=2594005 RepID=UPI00163D8994|nr:WecB/TagA/CpsF family glycosyltransferase [Thalassotalea sp. PS06]